MNSFRALNGNNLGFNIFTRAIKDGGSIKCITVKDGNSKPSRDHEKERIKQIAEVTGTSYMAMEVNYFNFVDDQSVKLLLHMRANLEVLTVKT